MKRSRLIGLGLRLAVAGGRPAWVRLALMSLGFALGCGLLLAALSVVPASQNRDARYAVRYGQQISPRRFREDGGLLLWYSRQRYGEAFVEAWAVQPHGDAPVPAGLDRIPDPGQMAVSPALAEVLAGPDGPRLEARFRAHQVGTIGDDGLVSPNELFAIVGLPPDVELSEQGASRIASFHPVAGAEEPLDLGALIVIVMIAGALLIPIWLFVATATRLSAATREARFAAVRLAGGTQGQVRLLAGLEAGVAAGLGTLVGIPVFLIARQVMAGGIILGIEFFPSDFVPPLPGAIAVIVGLPLLAVVITLVTMRRLVVSPLGITRHERKTGVRSLWPVVLLAGIAILAWGASRHAELTNGGEVRAAVILGTGLVLTAFGLAGTAVWAAWMLARRLAGRVPSVSGLLGMRRLEADPSSVGRVVGGVAILIALLGVAQSGYLSGEQDAIARYLPRWVNALEPQTVLVLANQPRDRVHLLPLASIEGVESLELTKRVPYGGYRTLPTTAIIRTDGSPETLEALRDAVGWYASVETVQELRAEPADLSEIAQLRRVMVLASLFLLLVMGATLLVATVDWVMERRRALAVLSAVGVQAAVIRRSILAQVAMPLATSVIFGVAGAIVVTVLLYTAMETKIEIPLGPLGMVAAAVAVMVLVVTLLATPWVRIARRPDLLRTE